MVVEFFNVNSKLDNVVVLDLDFFVRKQLYVVDKGSMGRIPVSNVYLE